jgi:hypothetical protein
VQYVSGGVVYVCLLHNIKHYWLFIVRVKVKQSHYRPLGLQKVEAPRFLDNRHMKVVRLSALRTGRLYPQERFLVLISVRGCVDPRAIVRTKRLCQLKIPVTPSGIEPATFRLVAQCFNQLRRRVPPSSIWARKIRRTQGNKRREGDTEHNTRGRYCYIYKIPPTKVVWSSWKNAKPKYDKIIAAATMEETRKRGRPRERWRVDLNRI